MDITGAGVYPPSEAFEIDPKWEKVLKDRENAASNISDVMMEAAGAYASSPHLKTVCPPEGGMYLYTVGTPYPRKGHVYIEAVLANNQVKRNTLSLLHPYISKGMRIPMAIRLLLPGKIAFLEEALAHYWRTCDAIYYSAFPVPYLKEDRYKNCGRELWKFTYHFLRELGITEHTAKQMGKMVATMIEYEDTYQYVIEDLCTETTKDELRTRKGIAKLVDLLSERANDGVIALGGKFKTILKFASLALLLPKVKKAYNKALDEVNFANLQLDKADKFYCLTNGNSYKFFGKSLDERKELFFASPPQQPS